MYRAVTWLALHRGVDPQDEVGVAELPPGLQTFKVMSSGDAPEFCGLSQSHLGEMTGEVTQQIRTPEVTQQVSAIAVPARGAQEFCLKQQQQYGVNGGVVMEGRDIGTTVFPPLQN